VRRHPLAIAFAGAFALVACRAVLGIEDLHLDAGSDATLADATGDSGDGEALSDRNIGDTPSEGQGDAGEASSDAGCAGGDRDACLGCCRSTYFTESQAVYGAEQPCACEAGGCTPFCPVYCTTRGPDVPACTDCAARNLVDGGQCRAARTSGTVFAACLDTCPN
jgi:hypothetical protein